MLIKKMAMITAVVSAIALLSGCGVPQEEHDAKIAELNAAWGEIETLKGKVADQESLLKAAQGKVRGKDIELESAEKRMAELKEKEATTAKALADVKIKVSELEGDLESAKSATGIAEDRTSEVETALAELQRKYDKLKADFEQFKKNMRAIGGSSAGTSMPEAGTSDPDAKSAMDLLDEMSAQ